MNKSIFFILALALVLRLISLNQSLWLDEAINVTAARDRGVVDLITNYALGDFHPPLYHLVLHYWILIFGSSEICVRTPSIIFGLITIWFTFKISQLLFKDQYLLVLTYKLSLKYIPPFLLATSGLHLYYSQEARMYSLATMGITASFYYLLKLIDKPNFFHRLFDLSTPRNIKYQFGFVIFLSLGLYADYVPWLLVPLFLIYQPLLTLLATSLLLPWLPFFIKQLDIGMGVATNFPAWGKVVGGISVKNIALIPVKFLIGRVSIDNNFLYVLLLALPVLITGILFLFILKALFNRKNNSHLLVVSWLLVPLVLGVILSFKISLLSYFRFLFVLPGFYLVLTYGLNFISDKLKPYFLSILIVTNLISSGSYLIMPQFHRENWRGLSQYVRETASGNSALTLFPSLAQSAPYQYYQKQIPSVDKIEPLELPQTVFLMRYVQEIFDPSDSKKALIEKLGYHFIESQNFNGVVVWTYQLPDRLYASH